MEQVLVFPTTLLESLGKFQGVETKKLHLNYLSVLLLSKNLSFMDRELAEKSPEFKQLIPYSFVSYEKPHRKDREYLVYERSKKGGEARLHNLYSLGIGGHINPIDGEDINENTYNNCFHRELEEEIGLTKGFFHQVVGLINDDSNEVGKVHFGMVHSITLMEDVKLKFHDEALSKSKFQSVQWIKENKDKFENWSQLIIDTLI